VFIHLVSTGPVSITLVARALVARTTLSEVAVTIHAVSHPTQG
jgi:hypothetical protein